MDLLKRLYRIVRSEVEGTATEPRAQEWDPSHEDYAGRAARGDTKTDTDASSARDPLLAGYYANLELPYGADRESVRRAWKRLMKRYHPDMHSTDPEKNKVANELCAELTRAYQELQRLLPTP
jgi:DnaJ-domain-containing protein 1